MARKRAITGVRPLIVVLNRSAVIAAVGAAGKVEMVRFATAMHVGAKEIMAISQSTYVPVATGDLMGSGRVGNPLKKPNGDVVVEMMYGDPPIYAINVHETQRNYKNGRQWKYLETPAKQWPYKVRLPAIYKGLPGATLENRGL